METITTKTTLETETAMKMWGGPKAYDIPKVEPVKREITKATTEKETDEKINALIQSNEKEEVFKHVDKLDEILELNRDGRPTDTTVDNEVN